MLKTFSRSGSISGKNNRVNIASLTPFIRGVLSYNNECWGWGNKGSILDRVRPDALL